MPRRGYILLLVILGAMSLAFFSFSLSSLNRGYRSQVVHTKLVQASFQIAYSGYQRILAKIFLKPWEERFFRTGPVAENGVSLFGGTYDSFVLDAPGSTTIADIYLRVKLEGITRSCVWRVEHIPDILDTKYFRALIFAEVPEDRFPNAGSAPFSQTINDMMQKRETNRPQSEDLRSRIAGVSSVQDIAAILGAPAPSIPTTSSLPRTHSPVAAPSITLAILPPTPSSDSLISNPSPARLYLTAAEMAARLNTSGRVALRTVAFKMDSYELLDSSIPILEETRKLLAMVPSLKLIIEGHTTNIGESEESLIEFSEKRAKSVFDWLVGKNVSPDRLQIVGMGGGKPIDSNSTAAGKIKNRRVEIVKAP
ncbi:MAG: OmpA family protein [Candidatus Ozemobacteraceae bacterium]